MTEVAGVQHLKLGSSGWDGDGIGIISVGAGDPTGSDVFLLFPKDANWNVRIQRNVNSFHNSSVFFYHSC